MSVLAADLTGLAGVPKVSHDFDFLVGHWTVDNRRLTSPLTGGIEWYSSTAVATSLTQHGGAVSIDEMWFPDQGFAGSSIRLRSADGTWTIHWVSSTTGQLQPPVAGRWDDARSLFVATGPDELHGVAILARYLWHSIGADQATWEQAFSTDDGETWETNWVMVWTRAGNR